MKKTLMLAGLLSGIIFVPANAAQTPRSAGYDNRVQYVNHNPDNVVHIRTKVGVATLIQLQEGETVLKDSDGTSGLGMGFGKAWGLSIRGNNLFLKPTAPNPDTNLLITTNKKRTYIFQISLAKGKAVPTYVLRFNYPGEARYKRQLQNEREMEAAAILRASNSKKRRAADYNRNYWGRGDKDLAPTEMFDDGRFTYFRYDNAKALPAVFKVNPDGSEAAVNTHTEGDTLVVHETSKKFVLRSGRSVLGVENRSFDKTGSFNMTGSNQANTVRLRKRANK